MAGVESDMSRETVPVLAMHVEGELIVACLGRPVEVVLLTAVWTHHESQL